MLGLSEITTAVDVDVGAGHVRIAPRREKRDDGPDFIGQVSPGHVRRMPEVLVDGGHQRIGIAAVDPTDCAHPTSASDAILPGETTLTVISSAARNNERFLGMVL